MAEYNLKNIKQDFKDKGIFYTQPELALFMKSLIDIEIRDVYDPTCGAGNLLAVFDDDLPKYGQELNDHQLEYAQNNLKNFTGYCGDTLKDPAFMDKRFSCIMGNPPFSIKWEPPATGLFIDERFKDVPALPPKSKADYAFLLHIIHLLADDGIAVVLNFPGIAYRGNAEGKIRRYIIEQNWIEKVIHIGGGTFVDTNIATICLVLKKNKTTTDIEFIDDEKKISRMVSLEEVENNDFLLSVGTYVQEETEKVIVDEDKMNEESRMSSLRAIRNSIRFQRDISVFTGYPFERFLSQVEDVIKEFK